MRNLSGVAGSTLAAVMVYVLFTALFARSGLTLNNLFQTVSGGLLVGAFAGVLLASFPLRLGAPITAALYLTGMWLAISLIAAFGSGVADLTLFLTGLLAMPIFGAVSGLGFEFGCGLTK